MSGFEGRSGEVTPRSSPAGVSSALLSDADWVIWAVFLGEFVILAPVYCQISNPTGWSAAEPDYR